MIKEQIVKHLCRQRYRLFKEHLADYEKVQGDLREKLFRDFLKSGYGKQLGPKTWEEIPIHTYSDLLPWIEKSQLTSQPVKHFVQTSGSSSHKKNIPYTSELKNSFVSLFKIWAFDLLENMLKPDIGKIFMCLSPPTELDLKDDTQYLNGLLRWLLKPYIIFPPPNEENYQENVIRLLLSEENLGIISIWNPTYLLHLLDQIEQSNGSKLLWPRLQLISCWTDGWASGPAQLLQSRLPHALMQGKGLLATEAPLTVPLCGASAPLPLVDEVYFEFEDDFGKILTLSEVKIGNSYELILSQKGGLLRYRLQDRVRINGTFITTPCLTFIGRGGSVCDMVGEKLDLQIVEAVIREVGDHSPSLLIPINTPSHYLLLTESESFIIGEIYEKALQRVFHYRAARITGQLGPLKVIRTKKLSESWHRFQRARGVAWGDIKETVFLSDPSLSELFLQSIFG